MSILKHVSTIGWDNGLLCGEYIGKPLGEGIPMVGRAGTGREPAANGD